jgi:hypothetical protein
MSYYPSCVVVRAVFVCYGNRLEILASYHNDYTFMLRDTYITFSNGSHNVKNVSFVFRDGLFLQLSFIICFFFLSQQ